MNNVKFSIIAKSRNQFQLKIKLMSKIFKSCKSYLLFDLYQCSRIGSNCPF